MMAITGEKFKGFHAAMETIVVHRNCKIGGKTHNLSADHPLYRKPAKCKMCGKELKFGQPVTMTD